MAEKIDELVTLISKIANFNQLIDLTRYGDVARFGKIVYWKDPERLRKLNEFLKETETILYEAIKGNDSITDFAVETYDQIYC